MAKAKPKEHKSWFSSATDWVGGAVDTVGKFGEKAVDAVGDFGKKTVKVVKAGAKLGEKALNAVEHELEKLPWEDIVEGVHDVSGAISSATLAAAAAAAGTGFEPVAAALAAVGGATLAIEKGSGYGLKAIKAGKKGAKIGHDVAGAIDKF